MSCDRFCLLFDTTVKEEDQKEEQQQQQQRLRSTRFLILIINVCRSWGVIIAAHDWQPRKQQKKSILLAS
jgi:alpha-D-ribose 1-methylphosphonate 5-triphosphate diphosphatase PhnM